MPQPASAPLVSLCLATYNRAAYLDRYLSHHLGALDAAGLDYELVVSDNCSTDETPQILARYAAQHPRMRVSRQPRNLGAYPNILTTLRQARGEIVLSIADDDLAVPETLVDYIGRMRDDPELVMIQAPWLLMDETRDNAVIGQFYDFEGDWRFEAGQYGNCLAFVIQNHVFPECWLIRRSALAGVVGPNPRFAYSFFCMLTYALAKGAVLFSPRPHIAATAISKTGHVGNTEAMESWDVYRGGLELMASHARQFNPGALPDAAAVGAAITGFVSERMAVAAKLQAHARNWAETYQILRRLLAYELAPDIGVAHNDVALLAAVETTLVECAQRGVTRIVVAPGVPEHVLERMKPIEGAPFVRVAELRGNDGPRGYCTVGEAPDASVRDQDSACDVAETMERFPAFPAAA
ncbi:MAG: glycosyltransferase family 2 protein [Caulobacterales bacterium]|nr:glycosyltransferase family 2 protein [Caulobacterales bacterium]